MRAPHFWNRPERGPAAWALAPLGLVYDAVTRRRFRTVRPVRAALPVVCVGNFTAGGAGKTPVALTLAGLLAARGRRPAFLTRGYGGGEAGPLLVDPAAHDAGAVGDEALLLARAAPTVLARDRIAGADLAAQGGADMIVMDDGLQNPALAKTVAVAVVDGETGVGNGCVIPAGPLRARLDFQLGLVHALVVAGAGAAGEAVAEAARARGLRVFRGTIRPLSPAAFAGERVVAFAGIGRPDKFFRLLEEVGAQIVARRAFGDHHVYGEADAGTLLRLADEAAAQLVTTEKDLARLRGCGGSAGRLGERAAALPVAFVFDQPGDVSDFVLGRIAGG